MYEDEESEHILSPEKIKNLARMEGLSVKQTNQLVRFFKLSKQEPTKDMVINFAKRFELDSPLALLDYEPHIYNAMYRSGLIDNYKYTKLKFLDNAKRREKVNKIKKREWVKFKRGGRTKPKHKSGWFGDSKRHSLTARKAWRKKHGK